MGGETYELDGLDFLNPASTAAVLFQTFMGAACVFTHEGGAYQIQLVNQRFIEELGGFLPRRRRVGRMFAGGLPTRRRARSTG